MDVVLRDIIHPSRWALQRPRDEADWNVIDGRHRLDTVGHIDVRELEPSEARDEDGEDENQVATATIKSRTENRSQGNLMARSFSPI